MNNVLGILVQIVTAIGKVALVKETPVMLTVVEALVGLAGVIGNTMFSADFSKEEKADIYARSLRSLDVAWQVLQEAGIEVAADIPGILAAASGNLIKTELGIN